MERARIAREWLERTLETYPDETVRFLRGEKDRFRNPVGHALQEGLSILVEELFGAMDRARVTQALDGILRIRAVQDFTPSQAVGFVFLLKRVVADPALEGRIDELALAAFDIYMRCREQLYEIRAKEARRNLCARFSA